MQRGQGRGGAGSGQQRASAHLARRPGRGDSVVFVVEGIVVAGAVALPLCQSPLCWRDMGTNLVGQLRWWWVVEEGAGAGAPAVEC